MPRFRITETLITLVTVDVEATDENEAREKYFLGEYADTDRFEEVTDSQGLTITEEQDA